MKILITGSCGFIGGHLCERLLKDHNNIIIGIDNFNSIIYSNNEKIKTFNLLKKYNNYIHLKDDILNDNYILNNKPNIIIHLAAHANVRKSLEIPTQFINNNVEVTCKILHEITQLDYIPLLIYASSSSVYGNNKKIPFNENDDLNNLISPYSLSKKMYEELVTLYCNTNNIKAIGLRFFSVYGPRGRPDMAPYIFLNNIMNSKEIIMYGDGSMQRDFTYIDDIINGIISCLNIKINNCDHYIYNLGNNQPVKLIDFINLCEKITGNTAIIINKPQLIGDVKITYADITKAKTELNYNPNISLEQGLLNTYNWLKKLN